MRPRTRYLTVDGRSVAYQVFGEGDTDLCVVFNYISHLDWVWADPDIARMLRHAAARSRVVMYDRGGVGLSDPVPILPSMEDRVDELLAVLDAAEMARPDIIANMDGAGIGVYLAATRADRVGRLILLNPCVKGHDDGSDPPGYTQWAQDQWEAVLEDWGDGRSLDVMFPSLAGSPLHRRIMATFERTAGAPGTIRALAEASRDQDVTSVLPSVQAPTLVVANTHDPVLPIAQARYIAAKIPDAQLVELSGIDAAFSYEQPDDVLRLIDEFVGTSAPVGDPDRMFVAILFSDIVRSTETAASLGDTDWYALHRAHDAASRRAIDSHGGTEVKSTGDGFLATFPDAASAVRCGLSMAEAVGELGLRLRIGVHSGEVQIAGDDIAGLAVHAAARICGAAADGEVLVSDATRGLAASGGFGFDGRGEHTLRGAPGTWQLYSASASPRPSIDGGPRLPTRADRLQQTVVRHMPALGRGMARAARRISRSRSRAKMPTTGG